MAVFKMLAYGVSLYTGDLVNLMMGDDESDEQREKRKDFLVRSSVTGAVTDIFSPLPPADMGYAMLADGLAYTAQEALGVGDKEKFRLVTSFKNDDITKSLGTIGIGIKKAINLGELIKLSSTGKFTDEFGREKYISKSDKDALAFVSSLSLLANLGVLPADANTIARMAISQAKRGGSTQEGGKEGVEQRKNIKEAIKAQEEEDSDEPKLEALNKMLEEESDEEIRKAIREKIIEIKKPKAKTKEQREIEKLQRENEQYEMEKLLKGYQNKSEMKRYDPILYEETFGEGSEYYEQNKEKESVEKQMRKRIQDMKDEARGYVKPKKKKKRNKDGTVSRSSSSYYFRYSQ